MRKKPADLIQRYARSGKAFYLFEPELTNRPATRECCKLSLVVRNDTKPIMPPSPRYHTGD